MKPLRLDTGDAAQAVGGSRGGPCGHPAEGGRELPSACRTRRRHEQQHARQRSCRRGAALCNVTVVLSQCVWLVAESVGHRNGAGSVCGGVKCCVGVQPVLVRTGAQGTACLAVAVIRRYPVLAAVASAAAGSPPPVLARAAITPTVLVTSRRRLPQARRRPPPAPPSPPSGCAGPCRARARPASPG